MASENVIQGVKVNGTVYKYDYNALENLPAYYIVTEGEVLIPETTLTLEGSS